MNLSVKLKIGIGIAVTYTTCTTYLQLRTRYEIHQREQESLTNPDFNRFKPISLLGLFINPFKEYKSQSISEFLFVRVLSLFDTHENYDIIRAGIKSFIPDLGIYLQSKEILDKCMVTSNFQQLKQSSTLPSVSDQLIFTWLGQSCSLVSISGVNFLTDPIFENFIINPLGPKRIIESPLEIDELPPLDYIVISHDHPDHLEISTVKHFKNNIKWIVPLGLKQNMIKYGITSDNIIELNWWEEKELYKIDKDVYKIVCLPAMHWSGRCLYDTNQSLWSSFIILKNNQSVFYHMGDSGYAKDLFTQIANTYKGIKLIMAPIGQYSPTWHQKSRHIDPPECIKISDILKGSKMVGVHWGTFKLSSEPILEPKNFFTEVVREIGREKDYFVPEFGKTYIYDLNDSEESQLIEVRDGRSILVR